MLKRIKTKDTFRLRIGQTKSLLIQILKNGPLNTNQIKDELRNLNKFVRFNEETVRKHLRDLKSMNKVVNERVGQLYVWTLV